MLDQVFSDWNETHSRDYGKALVHIHHRLHQSPLFTDAAIERLIETYPREHYDLHTMDPEAQRHRRQFRARGHGRYSQRPDLVEFA